MEVDLEKIFLQPLVAELFQRKKITVSVLRLDKMHPLLGGNKWFKLKYNLEEARRNKFDTLLTFGGAFSNHIAATAFAGKEFGFKTIGVIRGEKTFPLNKTLSQSEENGMQLHFISREDYKRKKENVFLEELKNKFGNFYLIPEGGANELGMKGSGEIVSLINEPFTHLCCACGTGTTLAGISNALNGNQSVVGICVLKGEKMLDEFVKQHATKNNWTINYNYYFGGYAKTTSELVEWKNNFENQFNFELDKIYTSKLFFGVFDLIEKNFFTENSSLIIIHSGGLQGN